jgi:8-oxo-dGTP diphosphatase
VNPLGPLQRAPYDHPTRVEIDVRPLEPESLALAEPERERDGPAGAVAVSAGGVEQPARLVEGGVLELDETFEAGVRREVREDTGVDVEVERLTGVYKDLPRGIVALVFRCHPRTATVTDTAEAARIGWLTVDEITAHMDPAYAIRVTDALADSLATRAHDGTNLVTT